MPDDKQARKLATEERMPDYTRHDGLIARTDTTTPCRCGNPECAWTEADDKQRDRIEAADVLIKAEDERARRTGIPARF